MTAQPNRIVKLIMVTPDNNNKYYDMMDQGDGTWLAKWGRVGVTEDKKVYPISQWDKKYKEKVKKGYKDVTELRVITSGSKAFKDITDNLVHKLIIELQRYANALVTKTYLVGAEAVTLQQIQEAQLVLNELLKYTNGTSVSMDKYKFVDEVNKLLIKLFTIIPRKMKNVNHHLITNNDSDLVSKIIAQEQDNLDTMEGQVKTAQLQHDNVDDNLTLLDAMGLQIKNSDQSTIDYIKRKLGDSVNLFKRAFDIVNTKTQKRFDSWVEKADNKTISTFWHGSRNSNWWGILGTGLLLKPTNVVITGKMFGYGTYFADKARKSIGYTSLTGSYWAGGRDNKAFLSMFSVHTGNPLIVERHAQEHKSFNYDMLRKKGKYDSMFAKGGYDLRNNEYIVYKEEQATIKYLVEIGN